MATNTADPQLSLAEQISATTKDAMRAREKEKVAALRQVAAEIKRFEVDERKVPTDTEVLSILTKMLKQRKDSYTQFSDAGRDDLAAQESFEIGIIESFMPAPLSDAELDALIEAAVAQTGAASMKDMGKVMGALKSDVTGRTDMGALGAKVKARLG